MRLMRSWLHVLHVLMRLNWVCVSGRYPNICCIRNWYQNGEAKSLCVTLIKTQKSRLVLLFTLRINAARWKVKSPVSIFQNDLGAEPQIWGIILLDTMAYSRGKVRIVTDSDFCWPFLGITEWHWPFSGLSIRPEGSISRKLRPGQGAKAKKNRLCIVGADQEA